jgi:hypothetical protein
MNNKTYLLYGINTAMHLLRPGANWEVSGTEFTRWEDPRPCPTWDELMDAMEKIKLLEDSINSILLPEQIEQIAKFNNMIEFA